MHSLLESNMPADKICFASICVSLALFSCWSHFHWFSIDALNVGFQDTNSPNLPHPYTFSCLISPAKCTLSKYNAALQLSKSRAVEVRRSSTISEIAMLLLSSKSCALSKYSVVLRFTKCYHNYNYIIDVGWLVMIAFWMSAFKVPALQFHFALCRSTMLPSNPRTFST